MQNDCIAATRRSAFHAPVPSAKEVEQLRQDAVAYVLQFLRKATELTGKTASLMARSNVEAKNR